MVRPRFVMNFSGLKLKKKTKYLHLLQFSSSFSSDVSCYNHCVLYKDFVLSNFFILCFKQCYYIIPVRPTVCVNYILFLRDGEKVELLYIIHCCHVILKSSCYIQSRFCPTTPCVTFCKCVLFLWCGAKVQL